MNHKWIEHHDVIPYLWKCTSCGAAVYQSVGRPASDRKVIVDSHSLTCEEFQAWMVHGS